MRHPMQPLVIDNEAIRFKKNKIVCYILDHGGVDLNQLEVMSFSQDDRTQFAQLIGYSVEGFHELNYVSDVDALKASEGAAKLGHHLCGCRTAECAIHFGVPLEDESCSAQEPPADPNLSCDQCSKPQWADGSSLCSWRAGTEFGSCDGRQVRTESPN